MSEENVETFRRVLRADNEGDVEPTLEVFDPAVKWYPLSANVEGGEPYHGHDGVRRWWSNVRQTFEEFQATTTEVRDLGDKLIALGELKARFRGGIDLETEIGWLFHLRDGIAVSGHVYASHAETLEAAGLSE